MLRQQMLAQQARELALHYLAAYGEPCTPETYLHRVEEMEGAFLKALQRRHEGAALSSRPGSCPPAASAPRSPA